MILKKSVLLKEHCNYKIGGKADYFYEFRDTSDLKTALDEYKKVDPKLENIFILGSGTNVLFGDNGFHGLVLVNLIKDLKKNENVITSGAGCLMQELVDFALNNSLTGLEWAGGLPGTVGGAIRGNAGAFGGEIRDNVLQVESYKVESSEIAVRIKKECKFNYRQSIFKEETKNEVILFAQFKLDNGKLDQIRSSTQKNINFRKEKHPLDFPNVGSTFKNVPLDQVPSEVKDKFESAIKIDPFPVLPVAKLIASTDLVGRRIGGAQISTKHPNFILNIDHAKAQDVLDLIEMIKNEIKEKYDIILEEEIMIL